MKTAYGIVGAGIACLMSFSVSVNADPLAAQQLTDREIQDVKEAFRDANDGYEGWKVLPEALYFPAREGEPGGLHVRVIDHPQETAPRLCRTTVFWLRRRECDGSWRMEAILDDYHAAVLVESGKNCSALDFQRDYFRTPTPIEDRMLLRLLDFVADRQKLLERVRRISTDMAEDDLADAVTTGLVQEIDVSRMWPSLSFGYSILLGTPEIGVDVGVAESDQGFQIIHAGRYWRSLY
jgi:hypothetical protein